MMTTHDDSIAAIATPYGEGGLAVIRVSGSDAMEIVDRMWRGRKLTDCVSHTAHFGELLQEDGTVLDQAVATVFRGPNSFTGQNTVELSVHGSRWIQREVISRLCALGARPAEAGEFSKRAFMNGRMDLAQAEAVADLISASSKAAHRLAVSQISGAFSRKLDHLRDQLVDFASLLELELDFSEEDVEFADRTRLLAIATETLNEVNGLVESYAAGRVFREGVPVAIAGAPNVGKSTLLNRLLDDDKAIVSEIPGTTRDVIEDTREINGVLFRFYDTAGLRNTDDVIEKIGIEKAKEHIQRASIILWMIDASQELRPQLDEVCEHIAKLKGDISHFIIFNKTDKLQSAPSSDSPQQVSSSNQSLSHAAGCATEPSLASAKTGEGIEDRLENQLSGTEGGVTEPSLASAKTGEGIEERLENVLSGTEAIIKTFVISAKTGEGIEELKRGMNRAAKTDHDPDSELIVTNARHHASLQQGAMSLERAISGLNAGLSADLIAQDVREALHHLGTVTGAVTTDTLLQTIFSRFCIGK